MSENKKRSLDKKAYNLKRVDRKKSNRGVEVDSTHGAETFSDKKITDKALMGSNVKVKKKLPLAVDIIIGILMLALVCAVIVGAYILFRYYANDYETRNVTYTVVFDAEDVKKCASMQDGDLFLDIEGNSVYFGKIKSVLLPENTEGAGRVVLTVSASVKYRNGEGYFIGDSRVAVGSTHTLRYVENSITVTVVDLFETGGK